MRVVAKSVRLQRVKSKTVRTQCVNIKLAVVAIRSFVSIDHAIQHKAPPPPPPNCYVALSRPTVKCEKTGSGFFYLFFLCQIWAKNLLKFVFNGLKKHLHDYAF